MRTEAANNFLTDNDTIIAYNLLGGQIVCEPLGINAMMLSGSVNMTSQQLRFQLYYLRTPRTINGVKWFQTVAGVYTSSNNNRIGLYTLSGGTLTQVAASAAGDDATLWKTNFAWASKAFVTPYAAAIGMYAVGSLYSSSAQTTAPAIACPPAFTGGPGAIIDFTNSNKISATLATQTDIPTTQAMSALTRDVATYYFGLY